MSGTRSALRKPSSFSQDSTVSRESRLARDFPWAIGETPVYEIETNGVVSSDVRDATRSVFFSAAGDLTSFYIETIVHSYEAYYLCGYLTYPHNPGMGELAWCRCTPMHAFHENFIPSRTHPVLHPRPRPKRGIAGIDHQKDGMLSALFYGHLEPSSIVSSRG